MRIIETDLIRQAVSEMCIDACCEISTEVVDVYKKALVTEKSESGKGVLEQIIRNSKIAATEKVPACQDTGMTVVFMEIGDEVQFSGQGIDNAINQGVKEGYEGGYLRKSVVAHPIERVNTEDNTPAIIYYEFTQGNEVKISLMPKGFGSENMSGLAMLKPSDGEEGVVNFIISTIEKAGPNACPPLFVGVGLGGTADKAMVLAKKALLRKPGLRSQNQYNASLEIKLIEKANQLGIGPAGLGGIITVFDIFVETFPTHIAGLPVAVNICCHSLRHRERII